MAEDGLIRDQIFQNLDVNSKLNIVGSLHMKDGTNGQVLTKKSDGSVKFEDAGGGGILNNRINDNLIIGEDSTDLLVVNSETRFLNNVDVSAGTLTLADDQISGDKVEGGTIDDITINNVKIKGDVVIGEDSTDLMVVNSRLNIQNLPTNITGLSTGDIWVHSDGTLKVKS